MAVGLVGSAADQSVTGGAAVSIGDAKVALPGTVTPDMLANATRARIRIVMNATAPRRTATADSF